MAIGYRLHDASEPLETILDPDRSDRWVASDESREIQPEGISAVRTIADLMNYARQYGMAETPSLIVELEGEILGPGRDAGEVRMRVDDYRVLGRYGERLVAAAHRRDVTPGIRAERSMRIGNRDMDNNPTYRSGRKTVQFDRIQTRGVLAGAYRGKDTAVRPTHTHLVFVLGDDEWHDIACRQPLDNIVDRYGHTIAELRARPTCPTCGPKYDKLLAEHGASILEPEEPMQPNRAPRLHHGRADQLTRRVYWQESGEGDWTNVTLGLRDAEGAAYLGPINLEDTQHAVFRLADGRTVAQVTDMHRNHKGLLRRNTDPPRHGRRAFLDAQRRMRGSDPEPRFKVGDHVERDDGSMTGVVTYIGQYDELIGGYRYKVQEPSGVRLFWNETSMRKLNRNPAPPPPPRRRTAGSSLRRVRQITEEHERREKPFDPSIGYERETKPHHFALNPAEWKPFRLPDEEFDLRWAVWYGPDGAEGDVATEVELDGHRGFVVREYQNVDGLIEEYDESEPFLVHETFVDFDQLRDAADSTGELFDAMGGDDPEELLTIVPDNDEARLLILRYAAAIGVRYLMEHGGEESWAAELPH